MATRVGTEDQLKSALKHLITLNYDAIEASRTAIDKLEGADDQRNLRSFMDDHVAHTENLAPFLRDLGETPPDSSDMKALLTSGKVALGSIRGDKGVFQAMLSDEEETNTAYSQMTSRDDLTPPLRQTLMDNFGDEKRHKAWIDTRLNSL